MAKNPETKQESVSKEQPWSTYSDKKAVIKMPAASVCWDGPCEYKCTIPSPDTHGEVCCFKGHKPAKDGTCKYHADEDQWRRDNLKSLEKAEKQTKSKSGKRK